MARIAVFASGNGSNFEALAKEFVSDNENKIVLLLCNKEDAFALKRAEKFNIKSEIAVYEKGKRNDAEDKILKVLKEYNIDVIFLAGFMKILTEKFINTSGIPIINIHPSLLPKYKGEHAIEQAFNSEDKVTGISIHYVTPEVDSGEIIIQKSLDINRDLGLDKMEEEIHKLEHIWYPAAAKDICNKINNGDLRWQMIQNN